VRRLGRLTVALATASVAATGLSLVVLAAGIANDDAYGTSSPLVLEDQSFSVPAPGVFGNDTASSGLSPCLVNPPISSTHGGTVSMASDGSFSYTPPVDFAGTDTFSYAVASVAGANACPATPDDTAVVTMTVTNVNDPPSIDTVGACAGPINVNEDSGTYLGEDVCVSFIPGPANESTQEILTWITELTGSVAFAVGPTITDEGFLQFRPAADDFGTATLHVVAQDNGGRANGGHDTSHEVQVTINVGSVPDAPSATADAFTAIRDRTLNIAAPGVLRNDSDADGDMLSSVLASTATHGVLTLAANGSFSYTPTPGYVGPDAFSYRASDGTLSSAMRVVTLTVTGIPPIATGSPPASSPPSAEPTTEVTSIPSEAPSADPSGSLEPSLSAAASVVPAAGLPSPGPSAAPDVASDESGGISLPVLLAIVLLVVLLAFGAAAFVPRWLEARRTGEPPG
jgi:hypothetical protein